MNEFELISRYFDRDGDVARVSVGIGDDGAVLLPDATLEQIQVIDTLVAGVHFPVDTDSADIAYRAVAVNLSDIAAMGGRPLWMTLALTMPDVGEPWFESFASGLFEAADKYGVALVGGDTTRGPIVTVTVAVTGEVEPGAALLRSGAQLGDSIYVTGTLGDAAAGLILLHRGDVDDFLSQRFLRPTPRIDIGRELIGKASAAIDISDGLAGDLKKLLVASGLGGEVEIEKLPFSKSLCEHFDAQNRQDLALCGGDDYELCFTAPNDAVTGISGITQIGRITDTSGLVFTDNGAVVEVDASGYRHFE